MLKELVSGSLPLKDIAELVQALKEYKEKNEELENRLQLAAKIDDMQKLALNEWKTRYAQISDKKSTKVGTKAGTKATKDELEKALKENKQYKEKNEELENRQILAAQIDDMQKLALNEWKTRYAKYKKDHPHPQQKQTRNNNFTHSPFTTIQNLYRRRMAMKLLQTNKLAVALIQRVFRAFRTNAANGGNDDIEAPTSLKTEGKNKCVVVSW